MAYNPIPDGYHSVNPYLTVKSASKAIEYYTKAFAANEVACLEAPDGQILHAEVQIGNSRVMVRDATAQDRDPKTFGGTPVMMHLYVEDVDAVVEAAEANGAKILIPVDDQFYGDRSGRIEDPFGHVWVVSTRKEDVSFEEMQARMEAMMKGTD
ncbi:VOC family protein [bacterium]|nr:VOC family protein [bacterium]